MFQERKKANMHMTQRYISTGQPTAGYRGSLKGICEFTRIDESLAGEFSNSRKPLEVLVGLEGFEPPTHGLGNRCSIHLSYRPMAPTKWVIID